MRYGLRTPWHTTEISLRASLRLPRGTIGIKLSLIKEMSVHLGHSSVGYSSNFFECPLYCQGNCPLITDIQTGSAQKWPYRWILQNLLSPFFVTQHSQGRILVYETTPFHSISNLFEYQLKTYRPPQLPGVQTTLIFINFFPKFNPASIFVNIKHKQIKLFSQQLGVVFTI